jgi:hypothetical protein
LGNSFQSQVESAVLTTLQFTVANLRIVSHKQWLKEAHSHHHAEPVDLQPGECGTLGPVFRDGWLCQGEVLLEVDARLAVVLTLHIWTSSEL